MATVCITPMDSEERIHTSLGRLTLVSYQGFGEASGSEGAPSSWSRLSGWQWEGLRDSWSCMAFRVCLSWLLGCILGTWLAAVCPARTWAPRGSLKSHSWRLLGRGLYPFSFPSGSLEERGLALRLVSWLLSGEGGGRVGGALEAELQVRPACPAQPSPLCWAEQWAFLGFSSCLWADRTQDNPCLFPAACPVR